MMADLEKVLSEPTISVPEAGEILEISERSAYAAARRGEIPTVQVGRLMRVPTALFKRMLGLEPSQ
jgi:excisionase family DNA binding protein